MIELSHDEQLEIDAALHDGEGWSLPSDTPANLIGTLSSKGMIRMHLGRWQLTPLGFSYTKMFEGRS